MRVFVLIWLCAAMALGAEPESAAGVARAIQEAGLDPDQCYRVRDLTIQKDELKVFLTEGQIIFTRPVQGRRFGAVFTATGAGGDGEVLLLPPSRSERLSLVSFAKTPNLDEHFVSALFLFTDGTGDKILEEIASSPSVRKEPEAGLLMEQSYNPVLRNLTGSYEIRLVRDLLSSRPEKQGLFYAAVNGKQLGTFDVIYDPRSREQILVGQVTYRNERQFFDTWTSFVSRSFRSGRRKPVPEVLNISSIRIDARIEPSLHLSARTKITIAPGQATDRTLAFEISRRMQVKEARLDGVPIEVFKRDSMRANLVRGGDNEIILLVAPEKLEAGRTYTIDVAHEGDVVEKSGNGVYFVGSRGSWYPNRDGGFSKYDLTFRYPKNLNLVATGEVTEDRTEGEWRITRRTTASPIRFAGFNLGAYEKASASRAGFNVEVYANRRVEDALQPAMRDLSVLPPALRNQRRTGDLLPAPMAPLAINPLARMQQLATEVASAMEFMAANFGPPPVKTLTVSPIPGAFGQGFPGLLYLSTLAYLNASDRPVRTELQQTFFSELLYAHETAHQWWGNLVMSVNRQDDWIMESLANYSAMLLLERRKGRRALDTVLDAYRDRLIAKTEQGKTVESAGPIVWGTRLISSQSPAAWRAITYDKGSWIIHMLRMRMGDARFLKMLGEVAKRKQYQSLTTDEFRSIAAEFLPPKTEDPKLEAFFEQWVYGTGVPELKMNYNVSGRAPRVAIKGTITQTGVDEDFGSLVPVEVQLPGKRVVTKWIATASEPVAFTIDLPAAPVKVQLDPGRAVLAKR